MGCSPDGRRRNRQPLQRSRGEQKELRDTLGGILGESFGYDFGSLGSTQIAELTPAKWSWAHVPGS